MIIKTGSTRTNQLDELIVTEILNRCTRRPWSCSLSGFLPQQSRCPPTVSLTYFLVLFFRLNCPELSLFGLAHFLAPIARSPNGGGRMRTELRMLGFWLRRRAATHSGATPTTAAASATTPAWHFESFIRYIIRDQTIIDSLHSILKTP